MLGCAQQEIEAHVRGVTREQHTTTAIDSAKSQTYSAETVVFGLFSPNGCTVWRPHPLDSRLRRHQSGGMTPSKAPTRRRHAVRVLRMAQNPHHYRHGERQGHGEPGRSAHERQKPDNRTQARPHLRYKTLPAHLPRRISGTKLSQLARNGPIRRTLSTQGEFCTALLSKTPSRENFVPLSPPRSQAGRILYRTRGRVGASRDSTTRPTSAEGSGGTTGPGRGAGCGRLAGPA